MKLSTVCVVLAACGDGSATSEELAVQRNELGVTTIEIERIRATGDRVFELQGLDAAGLAVASIRVHSGTIGDLDAYLPGAGSVGSELELSIGGEIKRAVTRELEHVSIVSASDALDHFVALPEVTRVLRAEGFAVPEPSATAPAPDIALDANVCSSSYLLTSPTALQCCYQSGGGGPGYTYFMRADNNAVIRRQGIACKGFSGESCSGADCYFGPNGFARATIFTQSGTGRTETTQKFNGLNYYAGCTFTWYQNPPFWHDYPDVTGSFPTGQGCPGGNGGGGNYAWDY